MQPRPKLSSEWIKAYFDDLFERRKAAQVIPRPKVFFADGTVPVAHQCHSNVDRFVSERAGHFAVRGWLMVSDHDFCCRFEAHSVVGNDTGEPIDITPLPPKLVLPFLRHAGEDEQFSELRNRFSQITWPLAAYIA